MLTKPSQSNINNTDDIDIQEGSYYWLYKDDMFKLSKIKEINKTTNVYSIVEADIIMNNLNNDNYQFEIIDKDKVSNIKDRGLFKYFDKSQLNPKINDLSTMNSASYPSILYNLKFKNSLGIRYFNAGKVLVGLDVTKQINMNNKDSIESIGKVDKEDKLSIEDKVIKLNK